MKHELPIDLEADGLEIDGPETQVKKRKNGSPDQTSNKRQNFVSDAKTFIEFEDDTIKPSIYLPKSLSWFDMSTIHQFEKDALPEFFNNNNSTLLKTPEMYKEYRDFMINTYQQNPFQYLTLTGCRRNLVGDVHSIYRIHDFLEQVGLINYSLMPNIHPFKMRKSHNKSNEDDKSEVKNSVESTSSTYLDHTKMKMDTWTDEEYNKLLEGIDMYGDNWNKVSEHVGSKNSEQCILHFIQLPIEENYVRANHLLLEKKNEKDTSNPMMSMMVFLKKYASRQDIEESSNMATKYFMKSAKLGDISNVKDEEISKNFQKKFKEDKEDEHIYEIFESKIKTIEKKLSHISEIEKEIIEEREKIEVERKKLLEERFLWKEEQANKF